LSNLHIHCCLSYSVLCQIHLVLDFTESQRQELSGFRERQGIYPCEVDVNDFKVSSYIEIREAVHHINYWLIILNVRFIDTPINEIVIAIQSQLRSEVAVQWLNSYVIVVIAIYRYLPTLPLVCFTK
jgi:hypothetical protein